MGEEGMGWLPNGEAYMIISPVDEGARDWETADANGDWTTDVLLALARVANGDVAAAGVANGDVLAAGVANGDVAAALGDWGTGGLGLAWGLEDTNGRAGACMCIAAGEERHSKNCLTGERAKLVAWTGEGAKLVVRHF